jgi:hypothetical protein
MSRDRGIILERRRRFLAAALATAGVAAAAHGCTDKQTPPEVCLSMVPDDQRPCLEPVIEDDAGPPPQPCLSPVPDEPELQTCLSVEAPEDDFAQPPPDEEG